jgi:hypothetical protein
LVGGKPNHLLALLKNKVSLRMGCNFRCGYEMYRIHFTCLFCRIRRWEKESFADKAVFGSMKKDYANNTIVLKVSKPMPIDGSIYFLLINNRRKNAKAKGAILKKLLVIAEMFAN